MKRFINDHKYGVFIGVFVLIFLIIMFFGIKDLFFANKGGTYGDRLNGIGEVNISNNTKDSVIDHLKEKEEVNEASLRVQGKIIRISIEVNDGIDINKAKEIATSSLEKFSDKEKSYYDIEFFLTEKNESEETKYPTIGTKKNTADHISWTKS